MNYLGRVINNCKYIYNEINAATLTGAIDVVVVQQPDGTFTCSPFHVRFGKIGVLRSKEKIVDIELNGEPVDIHMKLGESGEAFFVEEVPDGEGDEGVSIPPHLACSPIPPDADRFPPEWLDEGERGRPEEGNEDGPPAEDDGLLGGDERPRTFRAATVDSADGPEPREPSTTEFRPIEPGQQSVAEQQQPAPEQPPAEFVKEDSPSTDETNTVTVSKRKRRKKSIKKKYGNNNNNNNNNNQKRNSIPEEVLKVEEEPEEEKKSADPIFQMEDLDPAPVSGGTDVLKEVKEEESVPVKLPPVQELTVERDIHFFSDTEITPGSSPRDERDFAPVQSDSEFETKRLGGGSEVGGETGGSGVGGGGGGSAEDHAQSWRWGELPTPEPDDKKQESQKWMLQNMLGFMKKTKHMRHKNESEGIYLSEVNSEDPEMAALYFPNPYRQANPITTPSQDFSEPSREEDAESGNGPSLPQSPHSVEGAICGPHSKWLPDDVAFSLCGSTEVTSESFEEHQVSFSEFATDPCALLANPRLVLRMDGKFYPWKTAAPLVMALFVFHKPLPQDVIARITGEIAEIEPGKREKDKQEKKLPYSWFNWSRINEQQQKFASENGSIMKEVDGKTAVETLANKPEEVAEQPLELIDRSLDSNLSSSGELKSAEKAGDMITAPAAPSCEKYRKTLRLTSEQISKLKLHPGANELEFSVTTAYQGTSRCKCFLFCWRYDDKIVVSDIDGTITKSDVLGHILPIVGKDWAQSGVAKLFTKIKENGYKLLYLSARAIGQSRVTREYLKSIKQEDLTLPEGPMLLNPTSLLNAFHTEVIEKKPEEFKISCLRDIQALFPANIKPFYAGYGNKINDVWAYQAVGIPIFRIFTINHRGELKHELTQTFQSTYSNMSCLVDQMFPASKSASNEDFSEFVYWREPIANVESLAELKAAATPVVTPTAPTPVSSPNGVSPVGGAVASVPSAEIPVKN